MTERGGPASILNGVLSKVAIRLVIADDQNLFRSGLARLLADDPRLQVVGQAANGREAIELARLHQPEVILMDIKMPEMDGIEATRRLAEEAPEVRVLVLTTFEADTYVIQALEAGARGYLLKDASPISIANSIVAVMAGERVMASAIASRVLEMLSGNSSDRDFYDGLTPREIEILRLMAQGMPNKQVAHQLGISQKTVRNHVSHMYEKLKIYDRAQAVLYAVRKGLVEA